MNLAMAGTANRNAVLLGVSSSVLELDDVMGRSRLTFLTAETESGWFGKAPRALPKLLIEACARNLPVSDVSQPFESVFSLINARPKLIQPSPNISRH